MLKIRTEIASGEEGGYSDGEKPWRGFWGAGNVLFFSFERLLQFVIIHSAVPLWMVCFSRYMLYFNLNIFF